MSTLEDNKIPQAEREEVLKKIFLLKAKQLKEDKAIFVDYQTGWFENLFDFDISCLKQLEDWMDSVIEKENSPELTQMWVFYRDIIRFSYYFLTFRWVKFAKECYLSVKAKELFDDFIVYLKEDCQKQNLIWGKDSFKYLMQKVSSAFEGDVWSIVDKTVNIARQFKDTSVEWFDYYVEYNSRLFPELKKFAFNHAEEVKTFFWTRFSGQLKVWMKQLHIFPLESLEYSSIVFENFFLMNGLVRSSFFEDQKRVLPLQVKQVQLYTQLGWKRVSNKLTYAKDIIANTIDSSLISYLSVEESQALSLRQEALSTLLKEEYPLRIEKCLNLFSLAYYQKFEEQSAFEAHQQRIIKLNSVIEKKLDALFLKKEERDSRIAALQKLEKKSDESAESRQKKIDEEFSKLQKQKDEQFEKAVVSLEKSLEENGKVMDKVVQEVQQSKLVFTEEYNRQQTQIKADKQWKKEFDAVQAKQNQYDIIKNLVKWVNSSSEQQFQTKLQKIEEENKIRIEKENKALHKAELEAFEKSYLEEEQKIQQLIKLKKRIPKKKPEVIAQEKLKLEELQQIRQLEEEEFEKEQERLLILQKEELKKKNTNFLTNYITNKQLELSQWMQNKGNSINSFHPVTFFNQVISSTLNKTGETMLWSASFLNTLLFGPLDNFKLVYQLGDKTSYLYKKALSQQRTQPAETIITEQFLEKLKEKDGITKLFSFDNFEANPLRKGNLIRLFKHNLIGSDTLSLAFFKIVQDKLMQYTSGTYQNYNNIVAGALSGAMLAFLMNPIDCFKTLYVATDLKIQRSLNNVHINLTCGLSASILSSAVYRGLQFPLYEHFKKSTYMKQHNISEESFERTTSYFNFNAYNNHISLGQKYIAAVSASLLSSVIAYPLDTGRKLIYTNIYIQDSSKHLTNIRDALSIQKNWYGGFKYNCIKQVLQPLTFVLWDHAASTLCSKSYINNYLY